MYKIEIFNKIETKITKEPTYNTNSTIYIMDILKQKKFHVSICRPLHLTQPRVDVIEYGKTYDGIAREKTFRGSLVKR